MWHSTKDLVFYDEKYNEGEVDIKGRDWKETEKRSEIK